MTRPEPASIPVRKYEPHPVATAFPPLSDAEYRDLLDSVKTNGVMTPIVLTADHLVVDGVHRMKAALEADVFLPVRRLPDGQDPWEVGIELNLARRHLNESQRAMIAARLSEHSTVGQPKKGANLPNTFTQGQAAEAVNVSERTVKAARKVEAEAAPEVVQAVDRGDIAVSDAAKVLDDDHDIQAEAVDRVRKSSRKTTLAKAVKEVVKERRVEAAKEAAAVAAEPNERWEAHHADLLKSMFVPAAGSVDLLFTDAPYGRGDCPDLSLLTLMAERVLRPGGSMLVLVGGVRLDEDLYELTRRADECGHQHYDCDTVLGGCASSKSEAWQVQNREDIDYGLTEEQYDELEALGEGNMRYQLSLVVETPGESIAIHDRRVSHTFKICVWMVKGKYDGPYVRSMVRPQATAERPGEWHKWGQTEALVEAVLWQFLGGGKAYEGGVVMDPMCGGGSTPAVALALGAGRAVAADADHEAVQTTKGRLANVSAG